MGLTKTLESLVRKCAISLGCLLLSGCAAYKPITESDRLCNTFPDRILQAKAKKHLASKSRYCLVHIRQIHAPPYSGMLTPQEMHSTLNHVFEVQKEIYAILEDLVRNHSLKTVHKEGFTQETIDIFEKTDVKKLYEESLKQMRSQGRPYENETLYKNNTLIQAGAAFLMYREGRISLEPAEKENHDKEFEQYFKNNDFKKFKMLQEKRENDLLEMISNGSDAGIKYVVFGGWHSLKNNIARWNAKNPDKRFSLIEITPKSYDSDRQILIWRKR